MSKKYRVAIIGSTGRGDYGHDISTVWGELPERVQVVALADDNAAGLAKAAERLKVQKAYADYRQMLELEKPDIVAVCTRHVDRHHAMIMAAVERGMHVFSEKPLCRTLAEADDIVRQCEMTHAMLAVAHQTHYSPKIAVVKKLIADGRLGQILELRGRGKEDARGGGEDLWVLGSHVMDLIRTLGGDAQWCFATVKSQGETIRQRDVAEGNEGLGLLAGDAIDAMYGMSSGATAYFSSHRGTAGSPSRFGLQILGSKGVLEIGTGYLPAVKLLEDASWSPGRSGKAWQDVTSAGVGQLEPLADGGALAGNVLAVRDLLAAIEETRQPLMSASQGRAAIEMIIGCFESQRVGGPVKLPLAERGNPLARLKA